MCGWLLHWTTVDLAIGSYGGGTSPISLSCPETNLSNWVFRLYKESVLRREGIAVGLIAVVSVVDPESVDCRDVIWPSWKLR